MTNLLPTGLKEQTHYAKLNRRVLTYIKVLVLSFAVIAVIFGGAIFYLHTQTAQVARNTANLQSELAATNTFQQQALAASQRLAAIKSVQTGQTRFSALLKDISNYLPQGVSLAGITLTGDSTKPLTVTVSGSTYDSILAFRNAIVNSPRFSGADLVSITASNTGFDGAVVLAFKPGAAK